MLGMFKRFEQFDNFDGIKSSSNIAEYTGLDWMNNKLLFRPGISGHKWGKPFHFYCPSLENNYGWRFEIYVHILKDRIILLFYFKQ